jgi:hypothetical protein
VSHPRADLVLREVPLLGGVVLDEGADRPQAGTQGCRGGDFRGLFGLALLGEVSGEARRCSMYAKEEERLGGHLYG